jgi:hypothetical protein
MTFEYRDDVTCDKLVAQPDTDDDRKPVVFLSTTGLNNGVYVPLDRVEEVIAGIRDAARPAAPGATCMCGHGRAQHVTVSGRLLCDSCDGADLNVCREYTPLGLMPAARQTTGQDDTDPTTADDPTPLRWGLGDVLHGDDDTTLVCFSGPDREPYWLELDPERAAALRQDLTPPAAEDTIGLCGHCGVPRENHHHGYTSTADVIAASPYSRTDDEAAPAVGQPAEAHDTNSSTWWTIQAQKPTGTWFNLSEGFSSADEARAWRDTEVAEPRNWQVRIVRVDQTETVAVEDER